MKGTELPTVSIIIPVKPGGFVKALSDIDKLDYPKKRLEVIVAEGCHPSIQRNEAVKHSKGDILYFLDDDACPDPSNIRRLVSHHIVAEVAVVGGPSLSPQEDTFIQKCFESLFISPFGGAGIKNRYQSVGNVRESTEKELILCNLSFKRSFFEEFGGLNEKLYPNEENDLMVRIEQSGYRLIHDPHMTVFRSQRKNIKLFAKQILNYGRGRMEQTLLYPSSFGLLHFIPLFFLLYIVSLFFVNNVIYQIILLLYFVLNIIFSVASTLEKKASLSRRIVKLICMSVLFPLMHLSYGMGMLWGISTYLLKEKEEVLVSIRKVS